MNAIEISKRPKSQSSHAIKTQEISKTKDPWTTERTARMIVGILLILFFVLGNFFHQLFFFSVPAIAIGLVSSSFTNKCAFHKLLLHIGFKDREVYYNPDGTLKK